jgi:hypothetical protein
MAKLSSIQVSIPVFVVLGLIAISVSLIGGVIIGALLPGSATAAQDSLSGWVTTFATVVICVLTIVLAIETWRLRAIQTRQIEELMLESIRPNVSVELNGSHVGMNFMNVRVANSGKGIARKIRFEFLDRQDQPVTAEGEAVVRIFHKLTMFRLGIQSLGINQELKSYLFSFLDLSGEIGAGPFTPYVNIRITFEDTEGRKYVNAFVFDFSQYEGFIEIESDPLSQLATEVKTIREHLGKISSGFNRLAVNVYDTDDRDRERERQLQMKREDVS